MGKLPTPQDQVAALATAIDSLLGLLYEGQSDDFTEEESRAIADADAALTLAKKNSGLLTAAPKLLEQCQEMRAFLDAELRIFPGDQGLLDLASDLDAVIQEATAR